jgi:hypothetical protein
MWKKATSISRRSAWTFKDGGCKGGFYAGRDGKWLGLKIRKRRAEFPRSFPERK